MKQPSLTTVTSEKCGHENSKNSLLLHLKCSNKTAESHTVTYEIVNMQKQRLTTRSCIWSTLLQKWTNIDKHGPIEKEMLQHKLKELTNIFRKMFTVHNIATLADFSCYQK